MILPDPDRELTVVNWFAGVGGCALGMKWAGFRSLGSFDADPRALRQLAGLTGGPVFHCDIASLSVADVRAWVPICPDVVIMSPPCKSFSDLLPAEQAASAEYVEMSNLALAGLVLACESWAPALPAIIVIENVRGIAGPRGAEVLGRVVKILHRYGYTIDQSAHDCGEIGGLAQHRDRILIVARQPEVAQDYLRRPPKQRVRAVGEVLGQLPSPVSDHGDEMHEQPWCSPMTWLRLACADPDKVVSPRSKGDWRDCRVGVADPRLGCKPRKGSHGVQPARRPARTVLGHASHDNSISSYADPQVGDDLFRGSLGVNSLRRPAATVRAQHESRKAPAVVDDRGWPLPTHYLVIEDGEHVLYGPEINLGERASACLLVIVAPDGTWHRPMTDRELAALQGFPLDCYFEGPSSTRPAQKPGPKHPDRPYRAAVPGRREWIGNAIPPPTAYAIGLMIAECLRSTKRATFLRGGDVWVDRAEAGMEASA